MATATRTPRRKPVAPERSHRSADIAGILLLAVAAVALIALAIGNSGVLGDGLAAVLRNLLGLGAWAVPAVLVLLGWSLLAGRSQVEFNRATVGAILAFLGLVGFLARPVGGDYFDPQAIADGGGYVGALLGWAFGSLLGSAAPVGLFALSAVGFVLALNTPVRDLVARIAAYRRPSFAKPRPEPVEADEPKPKKRAVVEALEKPVPLDTAATDEVPRQAPTKREPIVRDTEAIPKLDIDTSQPKEGYVLPPLSLLHEPELKAKRNPQQMQKNIETLEETLDQFGIEANVVEVATGPSITRYEITLGPGIKVSRISALADNIAMNLAASHVRVEAPIPGKAAIGVEVPNKVRAMVTLRELCESLEFHDDKSRLVIALGRDVSGQPQYADLTRMPHLLIGGATNSGKSICLVSLIMSLILRNTPKEVRLVMIDPKRVELAFFEGLPHLMCPVVKDVKEAPNVLRAVWSEMDRRYDKFSEQGVRNIDGWNEKASFQDRLPYIVVIIDELADLMIQASAEVETSICRLAQLARATGIHLVIATQRPSVDVITGTIKANIASRIAFSVSSQVDSRTILDQAGAERLIGRGDMLFMPIDASKPMRIQGCYVAESEIESVVNHWRSQEKPHYVLNPAEFAVREKEAGMREEEDADPLWEEAVRWVVDRGQASTSMLQRRFSIGFQRASRLLDLMEERSIVGPRDGPRPREVLVDPMEIETVFGKYTYDKLPDGAYIGDED